MLSWLLKGRLSLILVLVAGCLLTGFTESAQAAPGSWSSQISGLMVAMSDRASASQDAIPPASANNLQSGRLGRIHWQFQHPPGALLNAWLCHPEQCVALTGMRGSTTALEGRTADEPLHFRFALRPGQRPVRVQGLQLIVNYQ
ncbi:flagellar protein FlhE [Halomonas sp. ISL-60]|uniref:flagellar protein FlhE n=1 Tax=unclassified Halomonas TaxID=2609666 RepID=UPI001BECF052|nr:MULTISPECIES: flagellar protein FlhE [unclassified Halomonas]MBT2774522.1 flagellar protein FlhE [Halomonas sp. ISL-60]MBT2785881.1 flagellar protein FlhE [Halomonas sp. ISL-106]MBT2799171.1 flagellar protein FlhE [Halomonas sp. ISL-104]MBT2800363.1 flagellar protein FlhE [Halomonas sp. ISL-56]